MALDLVLAALAWEACSAFLLTRNILLYGLGLWMAWALVTNTFLQLPRQDFRYIGFQDFMRVVEATFMLMAGGSSFYALFRYVERPTPGLATWMGAALGTGLLWGLARVLARAVREPGVSFLLRKPTYEPGHRRVLIYGAGQAGVMLAQELGRHPERGERVVGFLDDDPLKRALLIQGIPVLGGREDMGQVTAHAGVDVLILALPSAPGSLIREITRLALVHKLRVKTVPDLLRFLGEGEWKPEIRDLSIEDLLRREPVSMDHGPLAGLLVGTTVLVTGAGGSIGSELVRQLLELGPERIILLGRGETSLWEAERMLRRQFTSAALEVVLCDIRNQRRLAQVFSRTKPQVVFHAAAHKHVPFLEADPEEAIENNVLGTWNVLQASLRAGVSHFVNISTDKAVNPTNVLGASKRLSEMLVRQVAAGAPEGCCYVSVRFGNVLGSRGSVVAIFKEQIERGEALTVTHEGITRFFMTIPEASRLVLQAGMLGESGQTYVLDMGEPVQILDLAKDMAGLAGLNLGVDIPLQVTGLRPGEKLFEELSEPDEDLQPTAHPKILMVRAPLSPSLDLAILERALDLPEKDRAQAILKALRGMVPTYRPSPEGLGRRG